MSLLDNKDWIQKSGVDLGLRDLLKQVVKRSGQSRDQIAEKMGKQIGKTISKRKLDAWIGRTKRMHLPAAYVEAFCAATGSDALQRHVIGQRLRQLLTLGEAIEPLLAKVEKKKGSHR